MVMDGSNRTWPEVTATVMACLASLLTFLATSTTHAQEVIDQQNPGSAWTCLNAGALNMSQGFTPSFSRMNFAEVYLNGGASTALVDGEFSLRVLRDGILERESEILTIPATPGMGSDYYRFEFPNEAYLATNEQYELELVNHSNSSYFSWCQSQNDSYPGGSPNVDPPLGGSGDFLFRTGMQSIYGPPQAVTHGEGYMVFESALAPQAPVSGGGVVISDSFFSGLNFEIAEPTRLSRVGAHFSSASGQIFAAVVEATGITSVPNPHDLSGSDVLATTLINVPAGGGEAWGEVDVMLQPGWYGMIFGSDKFGATGSSGLRGLEASNGTYWYPYSIRQSDGQRFFQAGDYRIFAEAASAPGTTQVRPTFDTTAAEYAGQWILTDGKSSITGDRFDFYGTDERALMEFDLSGVVEGATVTGVHLHLEPTQLTSGPGGEGPRLFFHGYNGDGVATAADASVPLNEIGATDIVTEFQPLEVTLDPAYIQSLIDQGATHLGLMVRGDNNGHRAQFATWEDGRADYVPLLTIDFATPGDFDNDGDVDSSDLAQWEADYGQNGDSDADGDGDSDGADFLAWQRQVGHGITLLAASQAVPEPSSIVLLIGLTAIGIFDRRR